MERMRFLFGGYKVPGFRIFMTVGFSRWKKTSSDSPGITLNMKIHAKFLFFISFPQLKPSSSELCYREPSNTARISIPHISPIPVPNNECSGILIPIRFLYTSIILADIPLSLHACEHRQTSSFLARLGSPPISPPPPPKMGKMLNPCKQWPVCPGSGAALPSRK